MHILAAMYRGHPVLCLTLGVVSYFLLGLLACGVLGFNRKNPSATRSPATPPPPPPEKPAPEPPAVRPDCCAQAHPYTHEFAQCLTADNTGCPHRLLFGNAVFCYRPQRHEIIRRTPPVQN